MLAIQRKTKILQLLREEGVAKVTELSKLLGVSEPTVRQDLDRLEGEGVITREHGGAYLKGIPEQIRSLSFQNVENIDKKIRIGKKAAEFIKDNDSIILDSGSTMTEIAKNIIGKRHLRVVTNSLNIALLLGAQESCEVLITGGEFKAATLSATGERAASFMRDLYIDKLFLAAGGVSLDAGLTYASMADVQVRKAMIETAKEIYLIADSTKVEKAIFISLGGIEVAHYFITDDGLDRHTKKQMEQRGVKVILA